MVYFVIPVAEEIIQFSDQIKNKLISQLIKGISKVLQKLLRYFSGTIISSFFVPLFSVRPVIYSFILNELPKYLHWATILTSFVLPAACIFPVTLIVNLNDLEFTILSFGSSL